MKKKKTCIWFILPGFIIYTLFSIYPILNAVPNSFVKWGGIGKKQWVGLGNYISLFTHPQLAPQFFNAAQNTLYYLVLNLVVVNTLSILLAYLLFKGIPGHKPYKVIIFSPHFLYPTAIGFLYTLFFDPTIGLYSRFMTLIGLESFRTFPWLSDPDMGIPLLLIVCTWKGIGYTMLLYLAGFTMVSKDYEDAARIDGANSLQLFFKIYLPMIRPTLSNVLVLTYIWCITLFDLPYVIAGREGGINRCMDVLETFFYRVTFSATSGFAGNYVGIGSAISVCVFFVVLIGASAFLLSTGSRKYD